jgi:hypothetical protein
MGETRVDLHHLLEDLRDAYSGSLEETILTEIVANSLDSGARTIRLRCDTAASSFVAIDDGSGMLRRDLARYHDIASSTKARGQGIGFAGVGIKLGLLLCEYVLTETRRGTTHVATRWHLASRHKAPWKWEPPAGIVTERGTAVLLKLNNPLSPLVDSGFVESALRRHFQPLFEPALASLLAQHYPHGIRFEVNGAAVEADPHQAPESIPLEVRLARKRKPSALGYLVREAAPLPEDRRGLAISTLGKVIRRGWDWIGVTPVTPDRIGGLIEVPALSECLTLNKADFIRTGTRGATYLAYRKAIQEVVGQVLAEWGDARDAAADTRRRAARPVERDLERVLVDLADDFPLLATLVERREGGQRRLPIGRGATSEARELVAVSMAGRAEAAAGAQDAAENPAPIAANGDPASAASPAPSDSELASAPEPAPTLTLPATGGPRRPARYGLEIQFDRRDDDPELGRLVDSTVWVNEAHPAYQRAVSSRSEGYHLALTVAMSLAPLAVEAHNERAFVTSFLERWGEVVTAPAKRGR